jgi:orotidine-5'-phosphate decarboxylase
MDYLQKLYAAQTRNNSWLCVGLDPVPDSLPVEAVSRWDEPLLPFNKAIIDATADLVCAYKPNLGFYMQWGAAGVIALERTIAYIPDDIPIILDAKIGDIGHTQGAWGRGLLDLWDVDAVTVNPYVGREAIMPLVDGRPDKAVYILARTSNPGADAFQGALAQSGSLSSRVMTDAPTWDGHSAAGVGHRGFVIGATVPEELAAARALAPTANFLIPGVGAQGGDLAAAVRYGPDAVAGPVISISRGVIYASAGLDFAEAARAAALTLRESMNNLRG